MFEFNLTYEEAKEIKIDPCILREIENIITFRVNGIIVLRMWPKKTDIVIPGPWIESISDSVNKFRENKSLYEFWKDKHADN